MAHRLQSAKPLATRLILAPPRQFPRRTDAPSVGVQPQADQQPRVGVFAPGTSFDRSNLLVIAAQIQAPRQFPDRTDAVVFVHKLLDVHTSKNKLLAINRNQARNCGRLVSHQRSLHTTHHPRSNFFTRSCPRFPSIRYALCNQTRLVSWVFLLPPRLIGWHW